MTKVDILREQVPSFQYQIQMRACLLGPPTNQNRRIAGWPAKGLAGVPGAVVVPDASRVVYQNQTAKGFGGQAK